MPGTFRVAGPHPPPSSVPLRVIDLWWGVKVGWAFAGVLSAWVLFLSLLQGSLRFEKLGVSTGTIIVTYFAAGTVAGALVGLLRPLTRSRIGAAGVGALAGIIVYTAISLAMDGWTNIDLVFGLVCGIPVGGALGYHLSGAGRRRS